MASKKKNKPKIEFSKKILYAVALFTFVITVFTCYMIYLTQDLSPLSYLITAIFAECATATGFYFKKAEKENQIKLQKKYNIHINEYDFENEIMDKEEGM